jgi:hypothetical protein
VDLILVGQARARTSDRVRVCAPSCATNRKDPQEEYLQILPFNGHDAGCVGSTAGSQREHSFAAVQDVMTRPQGSDRLPVSIAVNDHDVRCAHERRFDFRVLVEPMSHRFWSGRG